jgi:hypothetical protein
VTYSVGQKVKVIAEHDDYRGREGIVILVDGDGEDAVLPYYASFLEHGHEKRDWFASVDLTPVVSE